MAILQVIGLIVSLVARLVLFFSAIPFLVSTFDFSRLVIDALAIKFYHNAEIISLSPASSTKFNLYLVAFISLAIYLVSFAFYSIYVAIFSKKRGVKNLTYISSFTFTIAILVSMLFIPSLEILDKQSLTKLKEYQPLYDWDHHGMPVDGQAGPQPPEPMNDPKREATLAWDLVQQSLHCCGFIDSKDWAQYKPIKFVAEDVLPRTCCPDVYEATIRGDGYCRANMSRWTKNCSDEVHRSVLKLVDIFGITIYFGLMFSLLSSIILISHPFEVEESYYESYADGFNIYHRGQHPNTIDHTSGLITSNNCKHHYGDLRCENYYYGSY